MIQDGPPVGKGAILTLNAGSSSLKFAIYGDGDAPVAGGMVDRIGQGGALRLVDSLGVPIAPPPAPPDAFATHTAALQTALVALDGVLPGLTIKAVGHRVVHGGPDFAEPVVVDKAILARLAALEAFAPLHQPHNLAGIRAAQEAFPGAVQVACFDTAFHRGHPFVNDTYALPRAYYDKGIRRYGFHGLSYSYIAAALPGVAPEIASGRVVVAHLGNGASICGMNEGRSISSTMGFTPLDGLAMGTRPGQIDPGVLLYLMEQEGMSATAIADLLYRRSGLLGLSGISSDMRALEASSDPSAAVAIAYFTARIRHEIGALAADLGGLDAIVFTGGIGENSARVRSEVCEPLHWLGVCLDRDRNVSGAAEFGTKDSRVRLLVVRTDEEIMIARAVRRTLAQHA